MSTVFAIIHFLKKYLKPLLYGIWSLVTFYLLGKNHKLIKKNDDLNVNVKQQSKNIEVKKKVINVMQKTKPTNLNTNIKRMRNKEL